MAANWAYFLFNDNWQECSPMISPKSLSGQLNEFTSNILIKRLIFNSLISSGHLLSDPWSESGEEDQ